MRENIAYLSIISNSLFQLFGQEILFSAPYQPLLPPPAIAKIQLIMEWFSFSFWFVLFVQLEDFSLVLLLCGFPSDFWQLVQLISRDNWCKSGDIRRWNQLQKQNGIGDGKTWASASYWLSYQARPVLSIGQCYCNYKDRQYR